jgi:hypothetical protein
MKFLLLNIFLLISTYSKLRMTTKKGNKATGFLRVEVVSTFDSNLNEVRDEEINIEENCEDKKARLAIKNDDDGKIHGLILKSDNIADCPGANRKDIDSKFKTVFYFRFTNFLDCVLHHAEGKTLIMCKYIDVDRNEYIKFYFKANSKFLDKIIAARDTFKLNLETIFDNFIIAVKSNKEINVPLHRTLDQLSKLIEDSDLYKE